jgi:hypothetical protein
MGHIILSWSSSTFFEMRGLGDHRNLPTGTTALVGPR